MKIVIVTLVWKRPNMSCFCLKQWLGWNVSGLEVEIVIVGSEGETSEQPHAQFGHYVEHENLPLGRKFNAGVQYTRDLSYDYLMIMGSDQIVAPTIWDDYHDHLGKPYIGVRDVYAMDVYSWTVWYWGGYTGVREGYPIGPGRLLRRDLVEDMDFTLYGDKFNNNLDQTMDAMAPKPVLISGRDHGMLSFKDSLSLNPSSLYRGKERIPTRRFIDAYYPDLDFSRINPVYH